MNCFHNGFLQFPPALELHSSPLKFGSSKLRGESYWISMVNIKIITVYGGWEG